MSSDKVGLQEEDSGYDGHEIPALLMDVMVAEQ